MSESPEVAEFEAAREAYSADEGHEDAFEADGGSQVIDDGDEGEHAEPAPKNWEKIAQDKDAALAGERARRKAERKRAQDLEERLAKIEGQGKGQSDPFEDLAAKLREDDEDPIGDINGLKAVVRQFLAAQKADREQEQSRSQANRHFQSLATSMQDAESDFAADHPDYFDAAKHYKAERQAELEALGYTGDALNRTLAQDLIGVVQAAFSQNRDPAETVYQLAKRRGFASGAKQAEDKLQKISDSTRAASRPSGGKPAGSGNLTPGSIAGLKGAAFDAAFAKLRQQERRSR